MIMYLPKKSKIILHLLVSPILAGSVLAILSFNLGMDVSAQTAQTTGTVAPTTAPAKRIKPTFFEEERRIRTPTPAEEREDKAERASTGFDTTFLSDAINGNQDPGAMVGNNPSVEDNRSPGFSKGIVNPQSPRVPGPSINGSFGIFQTAP
jgi:hypothetical protein